MSAFTGGAFQAKNVHLVIGHCVIIPTQQISGIGGMSVQSVFGSTFGAGIVPDTVKIQNFIIVLERMAKINYHKSVGRCSFICTYE